VTTTSPATTEPSAAGNDNRRDTSFHPLAVAAVDQLTEDAVAITFDLPEDVAAGFRFRAGQHVTLRLVLGGQEERRSYSLCSPAGSGSLRIGVKRLDGGVVSTHLTEALQPGDTVDVMAPLGRFGIDSVPDRSAHYAAVCAGSGITPILSIITTMLDAEPDSSFTLVYGNRTSASVMFLEELADLKNVYLDRLRVVHVLSREARDVALLTGRIDAEKLRLIFDQSLGETAETWFLCGPLGLVETTRAELIRAGVPDRAVRTEIFHVDGEPVVERSHVDVRAGDAVATVTATLGGRSSTFDHISGSPSLLDSMLRVRADAPFSCKGGVCGTCRALLVDGSVEMGRHYALESDEIDAGFVLACQSQPTSGHVTLDFDK